MLIAIREMAVLKGLKGNPVLKENNHSIMFALVNPAFQFSFFSIWAHLFL